MGKKGPSVRRVMAILGGASALMLGAPAAAPADGVPSTPVQGGQGVSAPGSGLAYVARAVRGGTVIERVRRADGAVRASRLLRANVGLAGVGLDGSTTGLSADGRRLVLVRNTRRYPPSRTHLLVLDARRLRVREHVSLPGFFTVDAISRTGRWLYLIHYTAKGDLLRYEVRAYDLLAGRLLRGAVVDPREPDEAMRGIAVTRATSRDGRWVYTLYMRPRGAPFVHALDTQRRTAACIDLPTLSVNDPTALHLALANAGDTLRVSSATGPQALIDTRTFAISPSATRQSADAGRRAGNKRSDAPRGDQGGGTPAWVAVAIALVLLAALAGIARARRVASP